MNEIEILFRITKEQYTLEFMLDNVAVPKPAKCMDAVEPAAPAESERNVIGRNIMLDNITDITHIETYVQYDRR